MISFLVGLCACVAQVGHDANAVEEEMGAFRLRIQAQLA